MQTFTTPKWIFGHVLFVLVLVSFTQFGFWQLRRHEVRSNQNTITLARLAAAPVPLAVALADALDDERAGVDAAFAVLNRRVVASGVFEPEHEVLRRPVSRDGRPGYHVVTPLALSGELEGQRLWVERGWVPDSVTSVPVLEAPAPAGEVTVTGFLRRVPVPPSGWLAAWAPRDPPTGRLVSVAYLDAVRLQDQLAGPMLNVSLWVDAGVLPASAMGWPLAPEAPNVEMGPHLGYAFQWFSFVLITLIGYLALLRKVAVDAARERASESPSTSA